MVFPGKTLEISAEIFLCFAWCGFLAYTYSLVPRVKAWYKILSVFWC